MIHKEYLLSRLSSSQQFQGVDKPCLAYVICPIYRSVDQDAHSTQAWPLTGPSEKEKGTRNHFPSLHLQCVNVGAARDCAPRATPYTESHGSWSLETRGKAGRALGLLPRPSRAWLLLSSGSV
jgi:hypothetical protein